MNTRRRRSLLFMPGDDRRKIEKGAGLDADVVVMDLEDGVAVGRKEAARETVHDALASLEFGATERAVRINPVDSGLEEADLDTTIAGRPDAYVVPKVESAAQVQLVHDWLSAVEEEQGWPDGGIRLLALVESAKGVLVAGEIAGASNRLDALIFGAEDFAGDIGATRTSDGREIFYARSAIVVAAAACGLQAIDTVFVDLHDTQALRSDAEFALQLGYDGKLAIHPRQVAVINDVFTPSPEEVARARRLVEAYERHQAEGTGAFEYEGEMVDTALVRAAWRVLARADEGD